MIKTCTWWNYIKELFVHIVPIVLAGVIVGTISNSCQAKTEGDIDKATKSALAPEEIVVVVNTESSESIDIGKLYIKLRKVPQTHLIEVTAPMSDEISRKTYDEFLANPVKNALKKLEDSGEKIRCIVTTYGIPLRIGEQRPSDTSEEEIKKYKNMIKQKNDELSKLIDRIKKTKETNNSSDEYIKKLRSEIDTLQFKLNHLLGNDTVAAVDSELALSLSPPYPLAGWQPNPEFLINRGRMTDSKRVLMVSRLDAPTPELAKGLIRTAIEVEKKGLSGKFYLDARGLTGDNDYSKFDEDIRRTAKILPPLIIPVVLDNRPELFRPGEAPSAALYCGWYSIGEYIDAFQWSKGAVGYHVASAEAVSIHNSRRKFWAKSMIEKGVIATLGPVKEPYLIAFPFPSLFFPLLMSGQYALVEVFAMTNPFLSWQMILIGDPLYNPFKNYPAFFLTNPPPPPN